MARLRSTRFGSGSATTPSMLQGVLRRGFRFTAKRKTNKGPAVKQAVEPEGLSARLKKLTKEYGWVTVGVYLGLSVLDFPFCFLFVRMVGPEKIGKILPWPCPFPSTGSWLLGPIANVCRRWN